MAKLLALTINKSQLKMSEDNSEDEDEHKKDQHVVTKRILRNRDAKKTPKGLEFYQNLQRK